MNPPDISNVPSDFVKWFLLMSIFAVFVVLSVIWFLRSQKKQVREIEPQPFKVEVKSRRFSGDACDTRHGEITRRLDGHDAELNRIWTEMRSQDEATRQEIRRMSANISRSLGRIEGKLGIQPATET